MNQKISHKLPIRTILVHFLFWMLSLVLFLVLIYLTRHIRVQEMDFQRRYFLFSLSGILNIALFICLNYFISLAFEGRHKHYLNEVIAEFILVVVFLVITTMIKFTRDSLALQDANLKIKEIERENMISELRALKAQINPHFFFNTLNSIYSFSLDRSEKTPELILKLSELMRYILYETRNDYVSMEKQLDFFEVKLTLELT